MTVSPEEQRIIRERYGEGPDSIIAALAAARGVPKTPGRKPSKDIDDRCKRAVDLVRLFHISGGKEGVPRCNVDLVVANDPATQKAVKRRLDNYYADELRAAELSL